MKIKAGKHVYRVGEINEQDGAYFIVEMASGFTKITVELSISTHSKN